MSGSRRIGLVAIGLAGTFAACHSAPPARVDDAELDIDVPAAWHSATSDAPLGHPAVEWWRQFGDPELDALVELGLRNNRNVRAALARVEQARAAQTIAGAPLLPSLDGTFDAGRSRRLFLGFPFGGGGVPTTTVTTYGLTLGVRWELDVWGRLRAGDAAALADQQAQLADLHGIQLSLCAQIARSWFSAIEARQQLQLARRSADAFRATLDDVRDRFQRGVRPALEVHQAATNLANAEAAVTQRQELLQRQQRQLDVLVGGYPDGARALPQRLPAALPEVPAGLPATLLQRRPDLVAAERRVAAAGCRVDQARAALYPSLSLTANGGTQSLELQDLADNEFHAWSLGGNLLAPLFRGGALRADVRRREAARREALQAYGHAVLTAFAEVEDLLATASLLAERDRHLQTAAANAAQARELARERWQLGLADFLAVADGQRQAFAAESQRLVTARLLLDNRIDLLLALGGGYHDVPATPDSDETR